MAIASLPDMSNPNRLQSAAVAPLLLGLGCGASQSVSPASAAPVITSRDLVYDAGGRRYEGHVSYPEGRDDLTPVLVFHDWHGIGRFTGDVTRRLAEAGCLAFAVDMYGRGVRPQQPAEAEARARELIADRAEMRARLLAGYRELAKLPHVDLRQVYGLGYSFGGIVAIEATQMDLPISRTVTLWGVLGAPGTALAAGTRSGFLVLHAGKDPFTPSAAVDAFEAMARAAGVSVRVVRYDRAYHAFGHPYVGDMSAQGIRYDPQIAGQAWRETLAYLDCGGERRNVHR